MHFEHLQVKPAGTDMDRAIVKVFSKTGHSAVLQSSEIEGCSTIKASQVSSNLKIEAKPGFNPTNDAILVEVPMVHSVNVETEKDASVDVSDFIESEFCQIITEGGTVSAKGIKTEAMSITTRTGDIICTGNIQGTVKLTSASGNVIAENRITGPSLDISTDTGDIRVGASYADQVRSICR